MKLCAKSKMSSCKFLIECVTKLNVSTYRKNLSEGELLFRVCSNICPHHNVAYVPGQSAPQRLILFRMNSYRCDPQSTARLFIVLLMTSNLSNILTIRFRPWRPISARQLSGRSANRCIASYSASASLAGHR